MQLLYSLYLGLTILALLYDLNLGFEKLEVYMVPTCNLCSECKIIDL